MSDGRETETGAARRDADLDHDMKAAWIEERKAAIEAHTSHADAMRAQAAFQEKFLAIAEEVARGSRFPLRDAIAIEAMGAIMRRSPSSRPRVVAVTAYRHADAMLEARDEESEQ